MEKSPPNASARAHRAEALLEERFAKAGWRVRRPAHRQGRPAPDFLVRRGRALYVVEVEAAAEGRGDRLVPLWAQAYLQALRAGRGRYPLLVVVAAPKIARRTAEQILDFAAAHAPEAAAGVIDLGGMGIFRGPHLEGLDADEVSRPSIVRAGHGEGVDLFSDLNQWMLKVLLAPELPERLLSAPRGHYHNASQLARAARVSVMSASRFVRQLEREGYLHESASALSLVRREDLFRRWQASAVRRVKELPVRFLLRRDPLQELQRMMEARRACLALFAAAEALKLGFVQGVPPHVYVSRLQSATTAEWKNLTPAEPGEAPDLIFRQASAPQSVFRGMVSVDGMPVCDVIQIWLDVASHPARGQEQAALIRDRVLDAVIRKHLHG